MNYEFYLSIPFTFMYAKRIPQSSSTFALPANELTHDTMLYCYMAYATPQHHSTIHVARQRRRVYKSSLVVEQSWGFYSTSTPFLSSSLITINNYIFISI